jgi:tetratricopeptide (TPR) repeat protein
MSGEYVVALGNRAFAAGKFSQAIKMYSLSLEQDDLDVVCLCNRSAAYCALDLFQHALKDAQKCIEIDPGFTKGWVRAAQAFAALDQRQQAEDCLANLLFYGGDIDDYLLATGSHRDRSPASALFSSVPSQSAQTSDASQRIPAEAPGHASSPSVSVPVQPRNSTTHSSSVAAADVDVSEHSFALAQVLISAQNSIGNDEDGSSVPSPSALVAAAPRRANSGPVTAPASVQHRGDSDDEVEGSSSSALSITPGGGNYDKADPQLAYAISASQKLISQGVHHLPPDQAISLGFLQVNTGHLKEGIMVFNQVLEVHPKQITAFIGRGTAYALGQQLPQAIKDFSKAISIDPACGDAWKRRGQSRAALGQDMEALQDLTQAMRLLNDYECHHQRGIVYHKMHDYKAALVDFKNAIKQNGNSAVSWNYYGLCENAIGQTEKAIKAYSKAISLDPSFKEGWTNMAQVYRDCGDPLNAEKYFAQAIALDPNYVHAYNLRGLERYGCGDIRGALADFTQGCAVAPSDKTVLYMKAVCHMNLGQSIQAVTFFSKLLAVDPDNVCFYQRELTLYLASRMDDDVQTYNYDIDLDKYMKESWCKRFSLQHPRMKKYKKYPNLHPSYQEVELKDEPYSEQALEILRAASSIGKLIQLNTPGFLPNLRQHRTSGLVMLDLAQTIRRYWAAVKAGETFSFNPNSSSLHSGKEHSFGWRDFMDIAVRWRQYSEPNDPVFWIDLLAPEAFAEGFGLQTPMVTGQMNVVRYFPYCAKAIELLKQLVPGQGVCDVRDRAFYLPPDRLQRLATVSNCDELFQVIGQGFYLETPCASIGVPGTSFSGTRITLLQKPPGGYEFTIRTPGTPARWVLYNKEFDLLWERMTKAATAQVVDKTELTTCIFAFYFYWCNFGPLSRGTAATGMCSKRCPVVLLNI